jgi:hypothetical protein
MRDPAKSVFSNIVQTFLCDVTEPSRSIKEAGKLIEGYMLAILNSVCLSGYKSSKYQKGQSWQS